MLYESIVKRGSLMVVPSGLADSLNVPSLMGLTGASGLLPKHVEASEAMVATAAVGAAPGKGGEGPQKGH
jgi:hypothetical protein